MAAGLTAPLLTAGSAALGVTGVAAADPFKHSLSPPCPFHALTGLWCPLCGGTRAVWAAAHGQLGLMVHENILLPALAAGALWVWAAWLARAVGWRPLPSPGPRALFAIAALVVCFGVVRNLPMVGAPLAPVPRA